MNILHTECSMNWGGQEYRTVLENIFLNQNNHHSWVMCHPDSKLYHKGKELGAKVVGLDLSSIFRIDIAFKILFFCKKHKVDIINSHGSKDSTLSFISFMFGIPLIRSRQITNPIKKKLSYEYGNTHIIAAAEAIRKILINKGISENKISVIGEGVDLKEFNPCVKSEYLRKEFNIQENEQVVVNVGMIRGDKGQQIYLEAARLILKQKKSD